MSALIWGNPATRQRSRSCAASTRRGPSRRTVSALKQSRPLSLARSSGRKSSAVERSKLRRDDQSTFDRVQKAKRKFVVLHTPQTRAHSTERQSDPFRKTALHQP